MLKFVCERCQKELEANCFKYDRIKHRYSKVCKGCQGISYEEEMTKNKKDAMLRKFRKLWKEMSIDMDATEVDRQLFMLKDIWNKGRDNESF